MGANTNTSEVGLAWAAALRRRYPGLAAAKLIARAFGCGPRTAEAWLAGQAPYAKGLVQAWRLHGVAIIAEVLAPDSDFHKYANVDAALAEVEAKLSGLGDELARLRITQDGPGCQGETR